MGCCKCSDPIYDSEDITCCNCKKLYHFNCGGIRETNFRKMTSAKKASWRGPCCNKSDSDKQIRDSESTTMVGHVSLNDIQNLLQSGLDNILKQQKSELDNFKTDMMAKIDVSLSSLDLKVEKAMNLISNLTDNCDLLTASITPLQDSVKYLSEQQDTFQKTINNFEQKMKKIENDNNILKNKIQILDSVKNDLNEVEQRARFNNVEIYGIPERKTENLTQIVESISKFLEVEITNNDILFATRIIPRNNTVTKPKSVIVKFNSFMKKDELLNQARKNRGLSSKNIGIPGEERQIYINEHLTRQNKNLLNKTRVVCKELGFRYVWTRNTKIYVRRNDNFPAIRIHNEENLESLQVEGSSQPAASCHRQKTNSSS